MATLTTRIKGNSKGYSKFHVYYFVIILCILVQIINFFSSRNEYDGYHRRLQLSEQQQQLLLLPVSPQTTTATVNTALEAATTTTAANNEKTKIITGTNMIKSSSAMNVAVDNTGDTSSRSHNTTKSSSAITSILDNDNNKKQKNDNNNNNNKNINDNIMNNNETAIIMLSSLIPSHPNPCIIKTAIESTKVKLQGLSKDVLTLIMVDGLPSGKRNSKNRNTLDLHIKYLHQAYNEQSNIRIVVSITNQHIGGSIKKALDILPSSIKYIYVLQHDFIFTIVVDHINMIKTFQQYPNKLRIVRFRKKNGMDTVRKKDYERNNINTTTTTNDDNNNGSSLLLSSLSSSSSLLCDYNKDDMINVNTLNFTKTPNWSDNNYFTTVTHMNEILEQMKQNTSQPPEWPMQDIARNNCSYWGQHLYGSISEQQAIRHLDGRENDRICFRMYLNEQREIKRKKKEEEEQKQKQLTYEKLKRNILLNDT